MQIKDLNIEYDKLQKRYGDKDLASIYNGGCEENPDVCFVFMNPTGKNISSSKEWQGRRSPWLGTKNIWKLFYEIGLLDEKIYEEIIKRKASEWTIEFADSVYQDVEKHKYFITNLGKCTQVDARALPNSVYKKYLKLLYQEISIIKPKIIVTFGNQVSSIILEQNICVSTCRKKYYEKVINDETYKVYPVFYPVGNGMRNIDKVIEDLKDILKGIGV